MSESTHFGTKKKKEEKKNKKKLSWKTEILFHLK